MLYSKYLPRWFAVWFYLSCLILVIGGISDELSGIPQEGMNAWAAGISIFILYHIMLFIWDKRERFRSLALKVPFSLVIRSILIGWFFAEIDELVNFPFNPLSPGVTLIQDIVFTTPPYILAHLFWFWVLKTYRFSTREALFTGGLSMGILEIVSGGPSLLLLFGILILPFVIMIHGFHMVMPKLALSEDFAAMEQKETRWKYVAGLAGPIIGAVIGIVIAFAMALFFPFLSIG